MKRNSSSTAKKGQISLFVVLALIIVGIIIFALFINTSSIITKIYPVSNVENIKEDIANCIEFVGEDSLIKIGYYAGQLDLSIYMSNPVEANYIYYNERKYLPTIEQMQDSVSKYIDENLAACTNLSQHKKFNITSNTPRTNTVINDEKIFVTTVYPVTVEDGANVYKLNDPWHVTLPVRLGYVHQNVNSILEEKIKHPEYLLLNETDLKITYFSNADGQLYIVTDPSSLLRNQAYKFVFAFKI